MQADWKKHLRVAWDLIIKHPVELIVGCLIACIIGVFFTAAYANAINAHLMGQAYYEAQLQMAGDDEALQQVALDSK